MSETINALPMPQELIGSRIIIQGASGAGKTYAIRKILETTHGQMQHFVLDVEDELFTLRERYDYVLIGGDHADAPLGDGAALARTLLQLGVSAIIALNDLPLPAQRSFIRDFIGSLMGAPRELWHPALVVLDESHRYAPTFGTVESSEALTLLATAGRKRGFGAIFATQRLSQLSKDILGQCPNRVMGRVDQSLDRKIAADTLGFSPSSEEAREMMRLKHRFWIVGPALSPEPKLVKFGQTATTHLQAGQHDVPAPPPPERVRAMLATLSKTVEKPKAVARQASVQIDEGVVRAAEERGYARGKEAGERAGRERTLWEIAGRAERLQGIISNAMSELATVAQSFDATPPMSEPVVQPQPRPKQTVAPRTPSDGLAVSAEGFLKTAVSIHPVKLTWGQLGVLCGRKARGGSFNTARRQLMDGGYTEEVGGLVAVKPDGFGYLGEGMPEDSPSREGLLRRLISALPTPSNDILETIAAAAPIATDDLGIKLGRVTRGGSWNTAMAILKANDLIRETPKGWIISELINA